jgi:signal transduction histidine kinase
VAVAPIRRPYNLDMERIVDKCVVLLGCLALVVLAGEVGVSCVVALLVTVAESALFELVVGRAPAAGLGVAGGARASGGSRAPFTWRPLAEAAPAVACVLVALVPGAWVALPLACYDLPRLRSRRACALAPCCVAWAWATGLPTATSAVLLALACCSMVLSWRCGRSVALAGELHGLQDDLQDKVIGLREKNRELEDARTYESHAAALAERTRIAREIHDSVGHQLTRLILVVEALKVVHRDDAQVAHELEELSSGLGEALGSMRASVHALEDSAVDVGVELNRLAAASGVAHVDVRCDLDASPPAEVGRCLVSVTREALTNAARHARASEATVRAASLPGLWQLRVENDGDVPADASGLETRGMGLRGMRERVEGLGGTFAAGADGRRFLVFASIPRGGTS